MLFEILKTLKKSISSVIGPHRWEMIMKDSSLLDQMATQRRDHLKLFISYPRYHKGDLVRVRYAPKLNNQVGIIIEVHEDNEYITSDLKFHYTYDVLVNDEVHKLYETLLYPYEEE